MGLVVTKSVFGVSDKVRLKPVFSATETSLKIEISFIASLDMILSNKRITKAGIRSLVCTLVFHKPPKTGFLAAKPI